MTALLIVLAAITTNALAGVSMKILTTQAPLELSKNGLIQILQNPYAWLAVTCYGLALILFTLALSKLDLSLAYPTIVSGAIILVTILSVLLFGESFTLFKAIGIMLILSGVYLLYRT